MKVVFTKKKMSLDEAINHAKEKSKELGNCPCGSDHKQLAEWLEELKSFKDSFWSAGKANKEGLSEKDVDPKELAMGIKVEQEHTVDKAIAKKIALDHLSEINDYYSRLDNMEKEAKK